MPVIQGLDGDRRQVDSRIEATTAKIEAIARLDTAAGDEQFPKGREFAAWLDWKPHVLGLISSCGRLL